MPDPHSRRGRYVGKVTREAVVFHHRTGPHEVKLREVIEAAAAAGGCSPHEVIEFLREECAKSPSPTPSGPSAPDHSMESGHGHRRDRGQDA